MRSKRSLLIISICLILTVGVIPFVTACSEPEAAPTTETAPAATETAPASVETIELTFSSPHPEIEMRMQDIDMPWFAEIEEATEGRVKIQPYFNQSLATMAESYTAVATGLADIAHIDLFHVSGQFPLSELQVLTSYDKKVWRPSRVFAELYDKFPEMQAEYADIKVLSFVNAHTTWLCTTKKAVRSLEDCQGMKWNGPGTVFGMRTEALGAVPVNVPPPEVYTANQNGVIDGGAQIPSWLWSYNLGELMNYATMVPINGTPLLYGMNLEKWHSLPSDVQKAIEDVSGLHQSDRADTAEWQSFLESAANANEEFGIEVIELSQEELAKWVETDEAIVAQLIAGAEEEGLPGEEFFEEYFELENKYSASEWEIKP